MRTQFDPTKPGFIALGLLARWPVLPSLWIVPPGTDHVCLRFDLERESFPRKPDRNQLTAAIALNANDRGILVQRGFFGTSSAGTVALTFLSCLIISTRAGPVPSHCTV